MAFEISCNLKGFEEFKTAMEQFDSNMQKQVHTQLSVWAAKVEASAKQLAPVRTGRLRSSIYAKIQEWVAEVGAEAEYALFIELGTRSMRAKPFLLPAIHEHLPTLEKTILEALDLAKAEARL